MNSILSGITSGASRAGIRIVLAAQEKQGKTTLCAGSPGVLLIPLEVGYAGVNVHKTPMLQTFDEFKHLLLEITAMVQQGRFPYRTLAIDSVTALERMIHDAVISRDPLAGRGGKKTITMDSAHGGYGKAYMLANEEFNEVLKQLDQLAV